MKINKGSNVLFNFKDEIKNKDNKLENNLEQMIRSEDSKFDLDNVDKPEFEIDSEFEEKLDMRAVLGYFNQTEWVNNINIGNIMQINPISIEEFLVQHK